MMILNSIVLLEKRARRKIKKEGDGKTPKGLFDLGYIYYRADKVPKPISKINKVIIKKNMGWCDDSKSKYYNKLIKIKKKFKDKL